MEKDGVLHLEDTQHNINEVNKINTLTEHVKIDPWASVQELPRREGQRLLKKETPYFVHYVLTSRGDIYKHIHMSGVFELSDEFDYEKLKETLEFYLSGRPLFTLTIASWQKLD